MLCKDRVTNFLGGEAWHCLSEAPAGPPDRRGLVLPPAAFASVYAMKATAHPDNHRNAT